MTTAAQLAMVLEDQAKQKTALARAVARPVAQATVEARSRIVMSLARYSGTVETASRTNALITVKRIIQDVGKASAEQMTKSMPGIIAEGVTRTRDLTKLLIPRGGQLDRIVDTYAAFERSIAEKKAFVLGSEKMAAFMDKYATDWEGGWSNTVRGLQAKFTQGAASGLDWRVVAKSIVDEAGKLVVQGAIDPEAFAEIFAKDKVTEIDNLTARALGDEAEMELYVNLGVPDDGQMEECYDACNAGAMTAEEWAASEYGEPLRHVGCR